MEIEGLLTAIVVGAIIGALARLFMPGKQNIGIIWTILIGIVGALVGSWLASALGVSSMLLVLAIEVLVAMAVLLIFGSVSGRRGRVA